ncbi:MAG: hypothetical protein M0D55_20170 [Elusimicrobiota bacterium]|nr:MAG: hypothetical protein M0D55_20170 [Elusimicrobiota bacterium]
MGAPEYNEKMLAAKAKMLERFKADKSRRDEQRSRQRLPPGQHWSGDQFPVLDLGVHPPFDEKAGASRSGARWRTRSTSTGRASSPCPSRGTSPTSTA